MKLIDPNAIKAGEKRLIDLILENMNWKAVKISIREFFKIDALRDISIDSGDMVIRNNQIAYQINLGPQSGVSLFVDQSGELIEITTAADPGAIRETLSKPDDEIAEEQAAIEEASVIASEISSLISEINHADQADELKVQK